MRKRIVVNLLVLLPLLLLSGQGQEASDKKRHAAEHALEGLPLYFEPNVGQLDQTVKFQARGRSGAVELTISEIVLRPQDTKAIHMRFVGGNAEPEIAGLEQLPGKSNYLIGRDSKNWRTGVPQFARVQYKELYPGIDAVFYANQKELEYDFVLRPGADPNNILMDFDTSQVRIERGDLVLQTPGGEIRQVKPAVYQEIKGRKRSVAAHYVMRGGTAGHRVAGFSLDSYDRTQPLIIDPTFTFTASGNTPVLALATDAAGNWYLAGGTNAPDLPMTNPYQAACATGCQDAYVVKLNPAMDTILYSTFLGGTGNDWAYGIGVDPAGNIHIAGDTDSTDFPLRNAFQSAKKGSATDTDIFVAELNAAGNVLVFSTYLSGSQFDQVGGLAVDTNGNTYITGSTFSKDFPTKAPFQSASAGGINAVVAKFSPSGSLVYSSFFGGAIADYGNAIAVDSSGNAYIAGKTSSPNFPTVNPFQNSPGKPYNTTAFVAKVNAAGSALAYSTFLGGSNFDEARAIAVDSAGNAYVTGWTTSTDFPTLNAFQRILSAPACLKPPVTGTSSTGCTDAFVAKLNPAGSLVFSSFLGGTDNDEGDGIAVDGSGQVYIGGTTSSTNFPVVNPTQSSNSGSQNMFIAAVKADGSALTSSTYLGNSANEFAKPGAFAISAGPGSAGITITVCGGLEINITFGKCQQTESTVIKTADIAVSATIGGGFTKVTVDLQVQNLGKFPADVTVQVTPTGWPIQDVSGPSQLQPYRRTINCSGLTCVVYALGSGEDARILIDGPGPDLTGSSLAIHATGSLLDPNLSNNDATVQFYSGKFAISGSGSEEDASTTGSPGATNVSAGVISASPSPSAMTLATRNATPQPATTGTPMPGAIDVFDLTLNNVLVTEAGVAAATAVSNARIFMDLTNGANTGIAAVNPNISSINLTATARDSSGAMISTATVTLPPNGHKAAFPNDLGLNLPSNFLGTLTLSSSSPFAAVALRLATNTYGEPLFSALPVADLNSTSTASALILPQIVDGGGIPTQILLMNKSSSTTATGAISLFDDNGNAFSADFGTAGHQSQLPYSLPPDGMIKFSTTGIGQTRAGYAVVTPQSGPLPAGSAIFGTNNSKGLASEAGVLPAPATISARMFTEVSSSDVTRNTGIALVNPNGAAATINLNLVDNLSGQVRSNTLSLPANGHAARLLTDLFPDVPTDSFEGTLTLSSNVPVASVALRVIANQRGDVLLSTLSVVDLNNPPTTTEYLAQIVVGGGYTTQLILISTSGSDSSIQMQFFDDNGNKVASPFP
jgi:hypothetical protein